MSYTQAQSLYRVFTNRHFFLLFSGDQPPINSWLKGDVVGAYLNILLGQEGVSCDEERNACKHHFADRYFSGRTEYWDQSLEEEAERAACLPDIYGVGAPFIGWHSEPSDERRLL